MLYVNGFVLNYKYMLFECDRVFDLDILILCFEFYNRLGLEGICKSLVVGIDCIIVEVKWLEVKIVLNRGKRWIFVVVKICDLICDCLYDCLIWGNVY